MCKSLSVECIGSFAHLSFWTYDDELFSSSASLGRYRGSINGNDAILVTQELRTHGVKAKCRVLNPTDSDMKLIASTLDPDGITAFGQQSGERTESLCLQNSIDQRIWVFSRVPKPQGYLGEVVADFLYIDYYPELVEFLTLNVERLEGGEHTIINLSAITPSVNVSRLKLRPSIVQASVTTLITPDDSLSLAKRLLHDTGGQMVFVTMGARGAVLAERDGEAWHCDASVLQRPFIGAGALFSSAIILGLQKGLHRHDLLKWSVTQTATRLRSWNMEMS